ncbi:hypothetical protein FO519_002632 [Halicephalobus sp. NKZ332]|nr:hypothetical protein FO519_002632 [Halicephalobus sp. NKZ332]
MALPVVSMEDPELFPKINFLEINTPLKPLDLAEFEKLYKIPNNIWWSRLVISIRGFVVNYVKSEDDRLFSTDDAFIIIHKIFVEKKHEFSAIDFVKFLNVINSVKNLDSVLTQLEKGILEPSKNPFTNPESSTAFSTVFGQPNNVTYRIANLQKHAYHIFTKILGVLLDRWNQENSGTKKKGIRFDKDPEWQPDDRVVLFEEFYQGNRTWVLTDFDRYMIAFWRPTGTQVIFGERQIEKKKRSGFNLCDYCGMLEQFPEQFKLMDKFRLCSSECLQAVFSQIKK